MNEEVLELSNPKFLERRSPGRVALHRLLVHNSSRIGLIIVGILVLTAIFAPEIAPYDPTIPLDNVTRRAPPCIHLLGCPVDQPQHLMGIDSNNRDLFSRVVYGSRLSIMIGLAIVSISIIVGSLLGIVAGFFGGWLDNLIMRLMDILMAFPGLLLAIAIVSVLGTGVVNALLAISIVSIPGYARIIRASILSVKEMDFVTASRALGASNLRLMFQRILPNSLTPLIVLGTLGIGEAILDAAGLSFLGLGAQPPIAEWGLMVGQEKDSVFTAPHLIFFPGVAIMITVLACNLIGDGLRDALDPRLSEGGK